MTEEHPIYMNYTIRYDTERLWWVVERVGDGALVISGPTSGSIREDAKAIEMRLEEMNR